MRKLMYLPLHHIIWFGNPLNWLPSGDNLFFGSIVVILLDVPKRILNLASSFWSICRGIWANQKRKKLMNNNVVYCSLLPFPGDSRYTLRIVHAHICSSIPLNSTNNFQCLYLEILQTIFTTNEKRGRENCEHCRVSGQEISLCNVTVLSGENNIIKRRVKKVRLPSNKENLL